MSGYQLNDKAPWYKSRVWRVGLALLGIVAFVVFSFTLENEVGIPAATTLRIATASACLLFIYHLGSDHPGERWPRVSLWLALVVNVAIFFTPLVDRPLSRGELMIFALPDAVIVLAARVATYAVTNDHQRAMRQQMILGLVIAVIVCAGVLGLTLMEPHRAH